MSTAISQLSCFSTIDRTSFRLARPYTRPPPSWTDLPRLKELVVFSNGGHGIKASGSDSKSTLSYTSDAIEPHNETVEKSYSVTEDYSNKKEISEPMQNVAAEQKRTAKIHDFCFGIPFGGFVLGGGLAGFILSRNPATLISGILFGGALLALSTHSLKIWRQGQSSLPYILGQAVLAAALLWKNLQAYSSTKRLFPTGFYAVISAAMLGFYTYVVVSGGNPPPKKLKASAVGPS